MKKRQAFFKLLASLQEVRIEQFVSLVNLEQYMPSFRNKYSYASKQDIKSIKLDYAKALQLLEEYDNGTVEIDYSAELKKLRKFADAGQKTNSQTTN